MQGADLTLDSDDNWLGSVVMNNEDSTLTLSGLNTDENSKLIASEGTILLKNNSVLSLGSLSSVLDDVVLDVKETSVVNLVSGDLLIDDSDNWEGKIDNQGGILTVNKNTTNKTLGKGIFTQTTNSSAETIVLGSSFDLNNALDEISTGALTVGNGVDNALLTVSEGNIENGANVTINNLAALDINGGNVKLNTGDSWLGKISLNLGNLVLDSVNKQGQLVQEDGKLSILSDIEFANDDKINDGILTIAENKTLFGI